MQTASPSSDRVAALGTEFVMASQAGTDERRRDLASDEIRAMNEIKVGDAEIRRVEEMPIESPMWVLTKDQALIDKNKHWLVPLFLRPDDHWDFLFQSWIVIVDGKILVIDPCTGNDRPHVYPLFKVPRRGSVNPSPLGDREVG